MKHVSRLNLVIKRILRIARRRYTLLNAEMSNVADLLELTSNDKGEIFMHKTKIRVLKGSPDLVAVVDSIGAVRNISPQAAQRQWNRLLKDHPELSDKIVSVRFSELSGVKSPAAAINDLVYIIGKLKGPIAALFARKGADSWSRILGGDRTLHSEVDACRREQERLAVDDPSNPMRVFGAYVEDKNKQALAVAEYAPIWKEKRAKQKQETKHLSDAISQP